MDSDSVRGRDSGSRSNSDIPYPLHSVSFAGICSAGKKRNFMTQPLRLSAVWLTELTSLFSLQFPKTARGDSSCLIEVVNAITD